MSEPTKIEKKRFRLSFYSTLILIILMWIIHFINYNLGMDLTRFGIHPRELSGLIGIITAPLLHGDWQHLIANSMSLIVLGTGLFYFYPKIGYQFLGISWILSGMLVWLMARPSYHIGASGVIYAIAGFLFLSGIIRKDFRLMAVSLIIVFMYGSMIWGIFPGKEGVSWESHFAGLFVGFIGAWIFRKRGPAKKVYSWEIEEEEEEDQETPEHTYYINHTGFFKDIEINYPEKENDNEKNDYKD